MRRTILHIVLLFSTSIAKRDKDEGLYDDLNYVSSKYNVSRPTTTGRSLKGEMVVEKFVDTLMASERYLKMVETVEKKISHLDAAFHDRTNSILKYLAELLRVVKAPQAEVMEDTLRSLKFDLERLKQSVAEKLAQIPTMRVEGAEYQMDTSLDNRLTFLESHMKNIMASVESIASIISEVKTRQNARTLVSRPDGTGSLEAVGLISEFRRALQEQKSRKCDCKVGRVDRIERYPTDCQEIQMQGFNVSGIYKIRPDDMEPFYVLCDLSSAGGGWTVVQNRFDGSQDFFKTWSEYKYGFGNLAGEFWLGLEKLNYLTNQKLYELRIEMESQSGQETFATFSVFTVGPEYEGYRISTLGTYRGNAGDSLSYHAGQKFSTADVDNDEWKDGACAIEHGGAWWYKECDKSNLNGKYSPPEDHHGQSIYWISFKGPSSPLVKTRMMIRPLPASRPTDLVDQSRKIMETSKTKPLDKQAARKGKNYDTRQPPYRYEDNLRAEGFFPTYA